MTQPQGFVDPQYPGHICKLNKAIYGLKQSPRQWYNKLTTQLQAEGHHVQLQEAFSLKEPKPLSLFLGIRISATPYGLFLDQQQYAQYILKSSSFLNCKPLLTPIALKPSSSANAGLQPIDPTHYRQLAGSLQYLTITRPDIAFATNQICQHMHDPQHIHLQTLKRLLRYIQGTITYGLPLRRSNLTLQSYVDADWASDQTDRKSISGFCTFLGDNLISWYVKKHVIVAKSSTEAEYRALAASTSDVLWL
ncbi:uncharacterized protein LOC110104580 [Dendrobium catenatum]|uniref:uncharacterized protein LOC110104580 n=1 Tax=Dendrobium catenatum TaxID=906689 RepID=UPI0009F464B8|nr:uncharacterized protein LOC110104580 [Dendrobium catenatum]